MTSEKNTIPATLATVKHGGCVQLGDAVRALPAEWRERAEELSVNDAIGLTHKLKLEDCADELEAAIASMPPSPAMGVTDAMVHAYSKAYDRNWEAQLRASDDAPELGTFFAMRAGLQAALSAQPSPGGQGDARIPFETWAKDGGFDVSKFKGIYNSLETRAAWEAWLYWQRLAARQPVGQIVGWQHCGENHEHMVISDRTKQALKEGETERSIQKIESAYSIPLVRPPVGEAVAWMTHHDEPMLFPTAAEAAAYCDDDEPPIPLYATPPAQAVAAEGFWLAIDEDGFVHFGQSTDDGNGGVGVRENVESRINDWLDNDGRSVDLVWAGSAPAQAVDLGQFREPVECWMRGISTIADNEQEDAAERQAARDLLRRGDWMLALIDSQAVGNG